MKKLLFSIPISYQVTNAISMLIMLEMSPVTAAESFLAPNAHPRWCHSIGNGAGQDFQKEEVRSRTGQGSSKAQSTTGKHAASRQDWGGSPQQSPWPGGHPVTLSSPGGQMSDCSPD